MTVSVPPPTLTSESPRLSHSSFNRPLGLGPSPSGLAIFCNRANTKTWYTLDANTQPQELEYPALTGYLVSIEFPPKEYRGEKSHKLRFKMQADRLYTLEAGYKSVFAKGFLSEIAMLTPEQLRQPITIEATPSDQEEKVLFCSVWLGSEKVYFHWDDQTNWKAIAQRAMANVAGISG
ncbi:hypothetical protein [Acaryochloris marina]|uniref:Uncharacterized protein n=1 Tax=Acaryochloris marina (strain MBIC 11017) TaxID=329726 RepID=A8ZNL9_ACAM1|nr:hypothetical protein [Acaryochloris marina]ABW32605.1 conserved hypothetical protein [Acaryochloris marina MBIC11017]